MIGITLGEFLGIGSEIISQSIQETPVLIYGNQTDFERRNPSFQTLSNITWFDIPISNNPTPKQRAEYVLTQLNTAIDDALHGKIHGLVTCPIDKNIVRTLEPNFDGHTSYLQTKTSSPYSLMLMQNKDFRIIVGTQHIALREVANVFTKKYFLQLANQVIESSAKYFSNSKPKIAVLGINPHAGEIDSQAEETLWLEQSILDLQDQGLHIFGPFPADSFFPNAKNKGWDFVISPYHDQALVAAKYNGLDDVVNITLGLPFLRTSPGHGVAYDIAGSGKASPLSFQNAFNVVKATCLTKGVT